MARSTHKREEGDSLESRLNIKLPYRGKLECKLLWVEGGISRYRANWYTKDWNTKMGDLHISCSKFIQVYDDGRIFVLNKEEKREV